MVEESMDTGSGPGADSARGRKAVSAGRDGGAAKPRSRGAAARGDARVGSGKAATSSSATKKGRGDGSEIAAPRTRKPNLKKDLREFASARPQGWGHDDWIAFLEDLQRRGHDVRDRDAIGLALEKERLDLALSSVKGVTAPKRKALVERYGNAWNLRNAPADDVAAVAGIDREAADRLKSALH